MDQDICSICLCVLDETASTLPCGHRLHTLCMINNFRVNDVCPMCRYQPETISRSRVSIEELVEQINDRARETQRERRCYVSRCNYLCRKHPQLMRMKNKLKDKMRHESEARKLFESQWKIEMRNLKYQLRQNEALNQLKTNHNKAKQNLSRARHLYHTSVSHLDNHRSNT